MKIRIVLATLALCACAKSEPAAQDRANQRQAAPAPLRTLSESQEKVPPFTEADARSFLNLVLKRDVAAMSRYAGEDFIHGGRLDPVVQSFLYKEKAGGVRSITAIAADGGLQIRLVSQGPDKVAAIYVPKAYAAEAKSLTFFQTQWMRKYFACEFTRTPDGWRLYQNFCFAETDGPYSSDDPE